MADTVGVIRSGFAAILAACKAQIVTVTGLPAGRVWAVARRRVPDFTAPIEVLLWPGRFSVESSIYHGGGRVDLRLRRSLHVICRSRLDRDQTVKDDLWFARSDAGCFAVEESVINALAGYHPFDVDNNLLTVEALELLSGEQPEKGVREDVSWGESIVTFGVIYELAVDQVVAERV